MPARAHAGGSIVIDYRPAEGLVERAGEIVAEFGLKVDVIVTGGDAQALAAKQANVVAHPGPRSGIRAQRLFPAHEIAMLATLLVAASSQFAARLQETAAAAERPRAPVLA